VYADVEHILLYVCIYLLLRNSRFPWRSSMPQLEPPVNCYQSYG
jgi:hypothetical protein